MIGQNGTNRVVVITGGAGGIGRGMAKAFAQVGDQVVLIGRHEQTLRVTAEAIGQNCTWQCADVGSREQVGAAVDAIIRQFGRIDVLINNAGIHRGFSPDMPIAEVEAIWDEEIGTNLTGPFLMAYAALPFLTRPGGRIINISSDAAFTGGVGLRTMGYVAAKAGILGLTRALAQEYSPQGITVNTITPGFIYGTGANQHLPAEVVKEVAARLPVRRPGSVEDIAAAALYLASPEAGFITGEVLNVNGGRQGAR